MPSSGLYYRRPALGPAAAGFVEWVAVLFGWVALILFAAWVTAAVERNPGLADQMFYGFCFACSAALGLREVRWMTRIVQFEFERPRRS